MLGKVLNALFVCIALPVLLFLPGIVLWRSVLARYERVRRYAAERLGPWTAGAVQAAASVVVTGWVGFVLGEMGVFSRYLLVAIVAALSGAGLLAVGWRPRARSAARATKKPAARSGSWGDALRRAWGGGGLAAGIKGIINDLVLRSEWCYAPVLLAVALVLFASPMPSLWRGHDAGRHLVCGMALAERGSFQLQDPVGAELWAGQARVDPSGATRLAGDYRVGLHDQELIYPAFLHFGATWVGIGDALLGRWGALHVTALLAVLGAGVFFVFVREASSVKVAVLATLLLVFNYAQAYFVRSSSPAVIAQLLAFTAFCFFVLFVRLEVKPFGVLAGLALGQVVLTGQHLYPALAMGWVVFACGAFPLYHPRKLYRFVVFPFLLFVFQPALFDTVRGTYYTRNLARGLSEALAPGVGGDWTAALPAALARLAGLVGLVVIAVMIYRTMYRRHRPFRDGVQRLMAYRGGLVLRAAGALAALAYVVVFAARHAPYMVEGDVVVHHAKWFYQLVDELAFGFFLLGVGLFVYYSLVRKRQPGQTFPFAVFFIFLLTAIWNPLTSGVLMPGAERLMPLYLPFAYFFVAYSLFALREVSGRLILGEAVKVLVVILAVVLPAITARQQQVVRPWARSAPGEDILAQYDEFFRREPFPRDAVVLFDPALAPSQVPLVMQLLYRVDSLVLDAGAADAGPVVERLAATGRPLLCAHEAGATPRIPPGFIRGPELELEIHTWALEETVGRRPRAFVAAGSSIIFVKLERAGPAAVP